MAHTDIQVGDVFKFRGLSGSPSNVERTLTVLGISTDGDISYRIDVEDEPPPTGPGIGSTPLSEATLLIAQRIWEPTGRA